MTRAMTAPRRIAILTGGGDVPGLNAVIKSVVYRATELGYDGPRHPPRLGGPDPPPAGRRADPDYLRPLDRIEHPDDRPDRRHDPAHVADEPAQDARAAALPPWLDARAASAATRSIDGPLRPDAARPRQHRPRSASTSWSRSAATTRCRTRRSWSNAGVPLVAIPKTMDNDVQGTEYCIGFSTAITRAKELINRQRTTLGSHERIGVFRIFGRDAGFSALYTAYVTSARCVIPEAPYDLDALAALLAADHRREPEPLRVRDHRRGRDLEGRPDAPRSASADAFGHRHKANVGEALALEMRERTGIETLASELTYDLRSGEPDSLDSMVATTFANVAMDLIADGVTGRMVAIQDGKYAHTDAARPGARAAPGRRRRDVQRRALPAAIRRASSATRCCLVGLD